MNRYTRRVNSRLAQSKAATALRSAVRRVQRSSDVAKVLNSMYQAINTFHDRLVEPITDEFQLRPNEPRDFRKFRTHLENIQEDLGVLYAEMDEATITLSQGFNFIQNLNDQVRNRARRLASKVEDLNLINNIPQQNTFVAGDNFADDTRIDFAHQSVGTQADLTAGGGSLVLKRTGLLKLVDPSRTSVEVQVNVPYDPTSAEASPNPNGQFVYEGRYFARVGQMEPAGGELSWESRVLTGGQERPPGEYTIQDPSELEVTTQLVPRRPTPEALQAVRRRMFDDDPATYWQIEFNTKPLDLFAGTEGAIKEEREATYRKLVYDVPVNQRAARIRQINNQADQITRFDFDVTLVLDLGQPLSINAITLDPETFGEEAWIEVLDIDTALTRDGARSPIEGLHDDKFENVLSPEANLELTDEEVKATLSPSRYQYVGQGLWTFPPREAQFVFIALRQKAQVPNPYEVVQIQLSRHVTTTTTQTKKKGIFG